jgi:methyl-accepting chemotaxis protein
MKRPLFKNRSIAWRLAISYIVVISLLVVVAGFGTVELRRMASRLESIVEDNNAKAALAYAMLNEMSQMAVHARTITILPDDLKEVEKEFVGLKAAEQRFVDAQTKLQALVKASSQLQEAAAMKAMIDAGDKTRPLLHKAAKEGADGNLSVTATFKVFLGRTEPVWRKAANEFLALEERLSQTAYTEAKAAQARSQLIIAVVVGLAIGTALFVSWRITRSIKRPIDRAIHVAERIADGDLTNDMDVDAQDEIGRLLVAVAEMQSRLSVMVNQIRDSAQSIQIASSEMASGNMDLSRRTEQAASNLQSTVGSLAQLADAVRESADSAQAANSLVSGAVKAAQRGGSVVAQVVNTMNAINVSSKKIAHIIGVIDSIAAQTNILALNAAVEAARAGEQGRGFAVVAGEVRSLAQRCAESAKEIKSLVGTSVEHVDAGTQLVNGAGAAMDQIVSSVQSVYEIVGKISAAAAGQSSGIDQINGAISELDEMTQRNAALVEEGAAAAESLQSQAQLLANSVANFRVGAASRYDSAEEEERYRDAPVYTSYDYEPDNSQEDDGTGENREDEPSSDEPSGHESDAAGEAEQAPDHSAGHVLDGQAGAKPQRSESHGGGIGS